MNPSLFWRDTNDQPYRSGLVDKKGDNVFFTPTHKDKDYGTSFKEKSIQLILKLIICDSAFLADARKSVFLRANKSLKARVEMHGVDSNESLYKVTDEHLWEHTKSVIAYDSLIDAVIRLIEDDEFINKSTAGCTPQRVINRANAAEKLELWSGGHDEYRTERWSITIPMQCHVIERRENVAYFVGLSLSIITYPLESELDVADNTADLISSYRLSVLPVEEVALGMFSGSLYTHAQSNGKISKTWIVSYSKTTLLIKYSYEISEECPEDYNTEVYEALDSLISLV